ncbi:MAG: hypothetical protein AAF696_14845 [Bacteroidota bacterium]
MKAFSGFLNKALFLLLLLCLNLPVSAQKLEIRDLNAERYPEISLIISGPSELRSKLDEENLQIFENEVLAEPQYIRGGYPLPFGLRIISSPQIASEEQADSSFEEILIKYFDQHLPEVEYFLRKDIPQNSLYDALQLDLEKYGQRKYRKRWFSLLLLDEGDTGSNTPFETLLGTVDLLKTPIYILYKGKRIDKELQQLSEKGNGSIFLFEDSEELLDRLKELNRLLRWGTEIRYISPQKSKSDLREVTLSLDAETEWGQILSQSYEHPKDIVGEIDWNNWPVMLLAVLLSIGAVALFFYWRSRKTDARHIYPAVTFVSPQAKKGKLKIRFNSPNKEMGARITIATAGGKPVKDFVYKGTRRRAKVNVSELPDGFYTCMLSNAGLNSEKVSFEIHGQS